MRSRSCVVISIWRCKANFALFDHASADKMGPSFDLFKNLRHIFSDNTDCYESQGTKKEHGQQ